MNAETSNLPVSEKIGPSTPKRRVRPGYPNAMGLFSFVIIAVGIGGTASLAGLVGISASLLGHAPENPNWSVWVGLFAFCLGIISVGGGLAMWRRREWGWWVMLGVVCVVNLAAAGVGVAKFLLWLVWLWGLRPMFVDPFQPLEADVDEVAQTLGIDWAATPLARISELLASNQDVEATRMYREHFGCDWKDAHSGIAGWQTDTVANKLRHIAQVVKSQRPQAE